MSWILSHEPAVRLGAFFGVFVFLCTYRDQPADGHEKMTIGLDQFQERRRQSLPWLLGLPFVGRSGRYPMGRDRDS